MATPSPSRSSNRSYASTRELPKNWSDEDSPEPATEPESVKSADDAVPSLPVGRSKSTTSRQDSHGRRYSVAEGSGSDVTAIPLLRPEKEKSSSRRSSTSSKASPRGEKKSHSPFTYSSLVTKEKLEHTSSSVLAWAKERLSAYKHVSADTWEQFKDGVALIHLIHECDNTLIDLENFDTSDPLRTLEAAFDIAEKKFGIPNLFDAKTFMDAKLAEKGPDIRVFSLYVSHFRVAYTERHRASNPVQTAQGLVAELKALVARKVNQVELLNNEFQDQTLRMAALSSKDELQAERTYLNKRAITLDKMIEMSRQLNSELEAQNLALREQIRLLNDKITTLTKSVDQEKQEKEAALRELEIQERIKAMAELLQETDIDKYIELHKEEIEKVASEMSDSASKPNSSRLANPESPRSS